MPSRMVSSSIELDETNIHRTDDRTSEEHTRFHNQETTIRCAFCRNNKPTCLYKTEVNVSASNFVYSNEDSHRLYLCDICRQDYTLDELLDSLNARIGRHSTEPIRPAHRPPLTDPDCNLKDLERERRLLLIRLVNMKTTTEERQIIHDSTELHSRIQAANLRSRCQCFDSKCRFYSVSEMGRCGCRGNPLCLTVFYEFRHNDTPLISTMIQNDNDGWYCDECELEFSSEARYDSHNDEYHGERLSHRRVNHS